MRPALLVTIAALAAAVHYTHGSPAGWTAYLFLAWLPLAATFYSRGMRGQNYWLSLTGLIEAWFIFEYGLYGTALSALGRSKVPLAIPLDQAYGRAYLVGTLALIAFACGAHLGFARRIHPNATSPTPGPSRVVFLLFTLAGLASLVILLADPLSRQQLFYEHVGLLPREGMGRYTALLFMLPTTAVALWYLSPRTIARPLVMAGLLAIAALHLGFGRRLMWAGAMLMIFHLLKLRRIFTFRPRYLLIAVPLMLIVSAWMEAAKNVGWTLAVERIRVQDLAKPQTFLHMADNSIGRFDFTAALIADRDFQPYDRGRTFLLAPLQVLPVSAGAPRSLGVREELGDLIYGSFGRNLASQEVSLVGELYANFSYFGVLLGFLGVGLAAAFLDARYHSCSSPLAAIGYGLCLFRVIHQVATASTSWFPLTFLAFLPWLLALAAARLWRPAP
jgi:hypothetical protein